MTTDKHGFGGHCGKKRRVFPGKPAELGFICVHSRPSAVPKGFPGKLLLVAVLCLIGASAAAVTATVQTEQGFRDLRLLGVAEGNLRYSFIGSDVASGMSLDEIRSVRIATDFDQSEFAKALTERRHGAAAAILVRPLLPNLQFLQLPHNNQTSLAMDALTLLMRAADERLLIGDERAQTEATRQYQVALAFAEAIARAEWYENSEEAAFRAGVCLVALGQMDRAREHLEGLSIPPETDSAFGWHALALARLLAAEERWGEALEAAVESSVFETKNVDSFVGALIVAATCYEALDEWHRARDVYFGLGRLMRHTSWETYAIGRLKRILDEGLADAEETQAIHRIFFSGREDLNAEAKELIELYVERASRL